MKFEAVLFDIDGTLIDSNDYHVTAWQEAFASIGASIDRQTIHDQIGKGGDNLVPSLFPDADEETRKRVKVVHSQIFKGRYLEQAKPFEGARELLVRVHDSGRRAVLASSAAKLELEHYLDLLNARELVFATTSGDDVEHTKPAPDIFAVALRKLSPITADRAIVVGDSPYDMQAAGKCGLAAIGLRSGKFDDEVLRRSGAVTLYDDAAALLREFEQSPLRQ